MITFKQLIASTVLVTLLAVPMAQSYPSTTVPQKEVILSDNPPTLMQTAGYVGLFLLAAYAFKTWFPPVPEEVKSVETIIASPKAADKKAQGRNTVTIHAKRK